MPTAVGAVVEDAYDVGEIPTYMNVTPEIASGLTKLPVVTETLGTKAVPNTTVGIDAVTVIERVLTVIV